MDRIVPKIIRSTKRNLAEGGANISVGCISTKAVAVGNLLLNRHIIMLISEWKAPKKLPAPLPLTPKIRCIPWVRNISGEPQTSFWLQTATDRFYPDFVVKLKDGRILIVEYKGAGWLNMPDSDEKAIIGQVWAERSGNLFLMATKKDANGRDLTAQINSVIR